MKSFGTTLLGCSLIAVMACAKNDGGREGTASAPIKAITGATLIDVSGGASIKDVVIIIEGTRVAQVGPSSTVKVPTGAQMIDARGKFVIPGLADMHNHLAKGQFGFGEGPSNYRANLEHLLVWGITLTFSTGIPDIQAFAELKRISADPAAPYPHFFGVGKQFGAKGGHGSKGGYAPDTPEEARAGVRENKAANVDAIKFVYSPVTYALRAGFPQLKPEVMAAIIDEAHKQNLKAIVHAPILKYAKEVLKAGADGLVHGIIDKPIDDDFIALMKKNRAIFITTHAIFEAAGDLAGYARRLEAFDRRGIVPKDEFKRGTDPELVKPWQSRWDNYAFMRDHIPTLRANTKKAFDAGLLVVAGSDTGDSGAGVMNGLAAQLELLSLVESGLTTQQALQTATINAARMIGRENELGSTEAGKLADLVILDADPLADIRNIATIHRVIKGGVVHNPTELLRAAR
jgi:imidazolonepropionase-like amidohydrolase